MYIKTKGTANIRKVLDVSIDPIRVLLDIKSSVCNVPDDAYIDNGKVLTARNMAVNGSPSYEYTEHTVTPNQMEIIELVNDLIRVLNRELSTSTIKS